MPKTLASVLPLQTVTAPRQARSEESLRRLLETAAAMIEEQGHQALSISELVRRAGSSIGGFYARFRGKDELLRALEEDFFYRLRLLLEEMAAPERWQTATAAEIVRSLIAVLVDTHQRHHRLILAFVARAVQDPTHPPELLAFRRLVGERLGALAEARRDLVTHPDPAFAAGFAVQAVFGILQSRLVSGVLGTPEQPLPGTVLAAELERLVFGYLGIAAPTAPPGE
jgi:AcrR family transcriptional regulator